MRCTNIAEEKVFKRKQKNRKDKGNIQIIEVILLRLFIESNDERYKIKRGYSRNIGKGKGKSRNEYTSVSKRSRTGESCLCCVSRDATLLKLALRKHLMAWRVACFKTFRNTARSGTSPNDRYLVFLSICFLSPHSYRRHNIYSNLLAKICSFYNLLPLSAFNFIQFELFKNW